MNDDMTAGLHAAILAAGPATRFGSVKQLARFGGEPLLQRAVTRAAAIAGNSVTVVIGAYAADVAPALRQRAASLAVNRDWSEGIASSIRTAVRTAPSGCGGLLLLQADQVAVTADDLRRLHTAWLRHPVLIVAAAFGGGTGLPAIFPRWAFTDLLDLRGDRDATLVLRRSIDRIVRVPMTNASINIDTPEDLLEAERRWTPEPN